MIEYYNVWMKQYNDALKLITIKTEVNKQVITKTLQTNDYVPFKDNGLDDVMKSWANK